ncbi:MAG: cytochrome P450, partial [Hyphomicrobiales bacterium]
PYDDHAFIQENGATKLMLAGDPQAPAAAQQAIIDYFDRLLRDMERDPDVTTGTILGRLVKEEIIPGHLSHDDAVAIAELLVVAGHETTANMVALGSLLLLQHPDQMQLLRDDPGLMGNAVEEMLRYLTITHFNGARVATEDVVLGGVEIRAGEGVWALLSAANRDDSAFAQPDRFDITREAGHHVSFGFGVHQCLGQGLARMELAIVFEQLLRRLPGLRLAVAFDDVPFKHDSFIFGVKRLPVAW